jgi:hypothetical protein
MTKPALIVLVAVLGALACTCQSDPPLHDYCTGIPAGGCPGLGGTANCKDTSCEAIYSSDPSCNWSLVAKCPNYMPPRDAGPGDGGDGSVDASAPDAHVHDAGITLPDGAAGGPACTVELEAPDCTVEQAALCTDCCEHQCQDLYVCDDGADGGWVPWGECDDAGAIVARSKAAP